MKLNIEQAAAAYADALNCSIAASEAANASNERAIAARYAAYMANNAAQAAHAALEAALNRARKENEA